MGSEPSTLKESVCSETAIVPSSAAKALPTRPTSANQYIFGLSLSQKQLHITGLSLQSCLHAQAMRNFKTIPCCLGLDCNIVRQCIRRLCGICLPARMMEVMTGVSSRARARPRTPPTDLVSPSLANSRTNCMALCCYLLAFAVCRSI